MLSGILVAIDGSPQSENALIKTIENIDSDKTKLYTLYVISPMKYATIEGSSGYIGAETLHQVREQIIETEKEEILERTRNIAHDRGCEVETLVKIGDPRNEILETAKKLGVELIVVGSTGKGLGQRLLLGSVSTYVVTHSEISTTVIR